MLRNHELLPVKCLKHLTNDANLEKPILREDRDCLKCRRQQEAIRQAGSQTCSTKITMQHRKLKVLFRNKVSKVPKEDIRGYIEAQGSQKKLRSTEKCKTLLCSLL